MEMLLEVGFVEALAAGLFIGFCILISWLTRPRPMIDRAIAKLLQQIATPERITPTQLTYRGVSYCPLPPKTKTTEEAAISLQESEIPQIIPDAAVCLSYRGVTYIKPSFTVKSSSSEQA
jgi:hypothetical protein